MRCWDDLGCWWTPSQAVWALSIGHGTSRWADGVRKRGADMCGLAPLGFPSFLVFLKAGFGGLKHAFLLESILMWTQIQASILFVKFKLFFFKSELLHVRIWSCCRFSVTLLRCRLSASAHLPECHGVLPWYGLLVPWLAKSDSKISRANLGTTSSVIARIAPMNPCRSDTPLMLGTSWEKSGTLKLWKHKGKNFKPLGGIS